MNNEEKSNSAKQRWAEKRRAAGFRPREEPSPARLPPGQHLTRGFPVLDLGIKPEVALEDWRLTVDGLVGNRLELTWETLGGFPRHDDISDFHCVTTWSKFDCRWSGVPFVAIYEWAQPLPEARFVFFTSYDEYTTNLPLGKLLDDDVLIATHFEGRPLTLDHGAPARMVVPKLYAWKSAKFLRKIEFLAEDRLGYWETRSFSNTADPFTEDRYA
jgi:DMSO/TMAO reductase YedYZ molybdopterin-dependent catalytic subunit